MTEGTYNVWLFYPDGRHSALIRFADAEAAVKTAKRAAQARTRANRIIITDGGDETVFEWRRGRGVTWPRR
jgi:hypothetical protein